MQDIFAPISPDEFDEYAAAHLLWRAGFGGTWTEVQRLHKMGLEEAVDWLIQIPKYTPPEKPPEIAQLPLEPEAAFRIRVNDLPVLERQKEQNERRYFQRKSIDQLKMWWLRKMLNTKYPLQEKMTLFWHSHFATSFEDKIYRVFPLWEQNELYRQHAVSKFSDILHAVVHNPAMLVWLDNASSRKERPNENFARELMELFSTGVNQYTEQDVMESARALTGYSVDRETWEFQFKENHHDTGTKTFLGVTGNLDGEDIANILSNHPATGRFISWKLLDYFVIEDPDDAIAEQAAQTFDACNRDLKLFLGVLFRSRLFYSPDVRCRLIKSPVVLAVGALKAMRMSLPKENVMVGILQRMGQDLFFPPDVNGWPGGSSWINSTTLLLRYNFANFLIYGVSPDNFKMFDREDASRGNNRRSFIESQRNLATSSWSPREEFTKQGLDRTLRNSTMITDYIVREYLQRPVPSDMAREYLQFAETSAGGTRTALNINDKRFDERIKGLVHLIMSSPEYQLC